MTTAAQMAGAIAVTLTTAACAADPNVIRYGGIVCERTPASPDVPRKCWPANSLVDEIDRSDRFGKPQSPKSAR